jgi:hypothetical protein
VSDLPPGFGNADKEALLPDQADHTASGLDETQIAANDLAELQAQFRFNSAVPGIGIQLGSALDWQLPTGLAKAQVQTAVLAMSEVRAMRMRLAPLPDRIKVNQARLTVVPAKFRRDLAPIQGQPIRRERSDLSDLTKAQEQAVFKAMLDKYGSAARNLLVRGVYREIPLESAKSVRLDDSLRFCVFTLPPGVPAHKLHTGYALIVSTGESGKTYPLLVRP